MTKPVIDYSAHYKTPHDEIIACKQELHRLEKYIGELIQRMQQLLIRIEELKKCLHSAS